MTTAMTPLAVMLLAAAATYLWRGLGVALSLKVDPNGKVFKWVSCLSYALLAALVSRMVFIPIGVLAETPTIDRVLPVVIGLGASFLVKRNVLFGVMVGTGCFILLDYARSAGLWTI